MSITVLVELDPGWFLNFPSETSMQFKSYIDINQCRRVVKAKLPNCFTVVVVLLITKEKKKWRRYHDGFATLFLHASVMNWHLFLYMVGNPNFTYKW